MENEDLLQVKCSSCGEVAQEPFIECCECVNYNICTSCFSKGVENKSHKNHHRYAVRKNDFPLFENCNWSAKEEMKLLSALSSHGYGNWEEIAKTVQTRSRLECQEHYKKYYIESVHVDDLDILPETLQTVFPQPVIPFIFNSNICRDPPRVTADNNQHLAGYNAFRSDFDLSYDHNAESIFNIDTCDTDDEDECLQSLKVSLVNAFNTRLNERQRRYTVIQRHGLISPHKLVAWMQGFYKALGRTTAEKLPTFMQFMTGMQFDAFVETLNLEAEKMNKISRLTEYRRNGIRSLQGGKVFKRLKKEREGTIKEHSFFTNVMAKKFESQSSVLNRSSKYVKDSQGKAVLKRTAVPLDIIDLPGFHLLSNSEKDLCSNLRLVPQTYLESKEQLIVENNKLGSLRLLDARKTVKIDVNKTRKIYDYLIAEGFVARPL